MAEIFQFKRISCLCSHTFPWNIRNMSTFLLLFNIRYFGSCLIEDWNKHFKIGHNSSLKLSTGILEHTSFTDSLLHTNYKMFPQHQFCYDKTHILWMRKSADQLTCPPHCGACSLPICFVLLAKSVLVPWKTLYKYSISK